MYYGWYIVGASFLILFFNSGLMYSFGVVFKPIAAEFGWGRGVISLAFSINMVVFALSISAVGKVYDRYGPKWVIVICTMFVSIGLFLTAMMTSLWQFFLFYGVLVAIGFGGTSIPIIGAMISKWFIERRGLAVSLAVAGYSLGQFVLVPVFAFLELHYGWRFSYMLMGLVTLVVNLLLALLVIKDGAPALAGISSKALHAEERGGSQQAAGIDPLRDMNLSQALRTRSYWLFMIVMFVCGSHDFLVTTHLIPFATDQGISAVTASNMLAWYGLMGLAGILIAGPVADRVGVKIPVALTFLLRVLIFLMILKYTSSEVNLHLCAGFGVHGPRHRASQSGPDGTTLRVVSRGSFGRGNHDRSPSGRRLLGFCRGSDFRLYRWLQHYLHALGRDIRSGSALYGADTRAKTQPTGFPVIVL